MHAIEIPAYALNQVIKRRGYVHPFKTIDPCRTALVVVDMQNAFCEEGFILEVPTAREIVGSINLLADAMRKSGGKVVWVQMTIPSKEAWPVFLGDLVPSPERVQEVLESLQPGGRGHALWPELVVEREDLVVQKNRFSAFLPSACNLEAQLRAQGIDTVIIAGTLTNVCCECSARDAAMQDFKVIMVSDANACQTDEAHSATLASIIQSFGDVRTTQELVAMVSSKPTAKDARHASSH